MSTYYLVKLDVDSDPKLNEAFAVFDDDVAAVEQAAKDAARALLRPRGAEVVWSYYGPYECPADRVLNSMNCGVV